jgi:hypothetical protein
MKNWFYLLFAFAFCVYAIRSCMGKAEYERIYSTATAAHPVNLKIDEQALTGDMTKLLSRQVASREVGSAGSKLTQDFILARFQELGLQRFGDRYITPFSFTDISVHGLYLPDRHFKTEYLSAANVVGFIRGSAHPDRYIVVSAHYDTLQVPFDFDSRSDNATGIANMLVIAQWFKQHPPLNTIVFAAFDGGELDQAGANAFLAHPPMPLKNIAVNLNLDVVGSNYQHVLYVAGTYHTPALLPLVEQAASWSDAGIYIGHDRPTWITGSFADWTHVSDHGAFHDRGIPFLYVGTHLAIWSGHRYSLGGGKLYGIDTASFLTTLANELDQGLDILPARK